MFIAISLGITFLSAVFQGWIFSIFWGLTGVIYFGMPAITTLQGIAALLIVRFLTLKIKWSDIAGNGEASEEEKIIRLLLCHAALFIAILCGLFMAWVFSWFA